MAAGQQVTFLIAVRLSGQMDRGLLYCGGGRMQRVLTDASLASPLLLAHLLMALLSSSR